MKNPLPYFLGALFVLATLHASATNYYVDPSSSGSNQGTFSNPWKSIADIPSNINSFLPGDTVFFKRGQTFTGTLYINSSGSNSAPIVFMPYGSGNAPVFHYDVANPTETNIYDRAIFHLSQVNYIVIDGFELTDPTIPETDHNVTANCGYGVYIYAGPNNNGSHNIIKNLTVSKLGAGVAIDGGSFNTVTNCNISNLRMIINTANVNWDDFGANGIIIEGSDNTITHNHIQDCWSNSYDYVYDGGAIEMYGPISNNKIMFNTAINNEGVMEFGSGTGGQSLNNLVAYNLFINNGHLFWINSTGGFGLDVQGLQLYNNDIVETSAPRLPDVTNLIGISATPSVSNVLSMKNNIFWLGRTLNITDPTLQPFNGPQLVHESNVYHMTGGGFGFTLDATERNLNSNDVLFIDNSSTDPSLWNYNLQPSSSAINIGQNVGMTQDFYGDGVPFGGAPDAGIAENIGFSTLPLQILSCKGWTASNGNNIEWVTNTDTADHFEVEKSLDGNNFNTIATVSYKTNAGSSSEKYQFVDNDITNEIQYYRIKVVEPTANKNFYSQIVSIKNSLSANKLIVSPNPAQDYVYLRLPGNDFQNKEMLLVTISGIELRKTKFNEASSLVKLDVSALPRGAYVIKLLDYKTGWNQSTIITK